MIYEKSCGAVVYSFFNQELRFLLVQMKKGHWGISKGHMEEGETEVQTAEREIMEETGLSVHVNTEFRECEEYSPYEGCIKEVVYFIAESAVEETIPQPEEILTVRWATYEEAMVLLTYENTKTVLRNVYEFLRQTKN